jgi:hypothetical protein
VGSLDNEILKELQLQRQLMEGIIKAGSAAAAEVPPPAEVQTEGMMTDYDCLLICKADNIIEAIDRWNKKALARRRAVH